MWPMCFITMVCLWWFDVGYIYGLGKHHGLYITNIITNIITQCITNIITNIITNWFIYILPMVYISPTLHDGYWSFWVMFLPTPKNIRVTDRCLGTTSSREDSCFKVQGVHATRAFWRQTLTKNMEKKVIFPENMVIFIAKMRCFQWTWWFYMHLLLKMVILYEWTSEHGDSHQVRNGDLS